jgi:hypothetical protein
MGIIALDSYREAICSDEHSIARKSEKCNPLLGIKASETSFSLAPRSNIGLAEVFLKSNRVEGLTSTLFIAFVQ